MADLIKKTACKIANSKHLIALTGAGVSVESGIPPFRGKGGLWETIDPMEYAHIDSFMKNPEKVWAVLLKQMKSCLDDALPNPAHLALAKLEKRGILKAVLTQNVDGLHQMAGNKTVLEYHGNFAWYSCMDCGIEYPSESIDIVEIPPRCSCGGVLRPQCVFFGESIPEDTLRRAEKAVKKCDTMLVIGTSALVEPFSSLPVMAKASGACVIEINRERSPLTGRISDWIIPGDAGRVMDQILKNIAL